jgi:hypothetical protein
MNLTRLRLRLARWLVLQSIDPAIRPALAEVFRDLDATLPQALMQMATPRVVEEMVFRAVMRRTGLIPLSGDVQAIAALFNPIAAARPLSSR